MILGVDFDNTIVAYDALFHRVALERGLIPADLPVNKTAVRDHLRATGREDAWTEMQGEVYGARLDEAEAYPGVLAFFRACRVRAIPVRIISHKTRHPFLGPAHDLHAAARGWLARQGFFDATGGIALAEADAFFELTKTDKLARIASCGCTHFIDDLPELLTEPAFPSGVARFLFDPQALHPDIPGVRRATSWAQLTDDLIPPAKECWLAAAERLATGRGCELWDKPVPLAGGANNRVVRLGPEVLAKRYFQHPSDPRDRFATERAFYHFAHAADVICVPQAMGWDEAQRVGLFAFVQGTPPAAVGEKEVDGALNFLHALNRARDLPEAVGLPVASEACFSLAQHLATVRRRVEALTALPVEDAIDHAAVAWVNDRLLPAWKATEASLLAGRAATDLARELTQAERVVSPSDFGFHNSLVTQDGRLVFLDFEYAGWDDPAKLVGDFFCQPDIPVPSEYFSHVVSEVATRLVLPDAEDFVARCHRLRLLYRIKWSCILLNEFTRAGRDRRAFSLGSSAASERRARQLSRAQALLAA